MRSYRVLLGMLATTLVLSFLASTASAQYRGFYGSRYGAWYGGARPYYGAYGAYRPYASGAYRPYASGAYRPYVYGGYYRGLYGPGLGYAYRWPGYYRYPYRAYYGYPSIGLYSFPSVTYYYSEPSVVYVNPPAVSYSMPPAVNPMPPAGPLPDSPVVIEATKSARLSIYDNYFEPARLEVSIGTTVTWSNRGNNIHTITSDQGIFDSTECSPGQTFSYTFDQPGTYTYFCKVHPTMRGAITVR